MISEDFQVSEKSYLLWWSTGPDYINIHTHMKKKLNG